MFEKVNIRSRVNLNKACTDLFISPDKRLNPKIKSRTTFSLKKVSVSLLPKLRVTVLTFPVNLKLYPGFVIVIFLVIYSNPVLTGCKNGIRTSYSDFII